MSNDDYTRKILSNKALVSLIAALRDDKKRSAAKALVEEAVNESLPAFESLKTALDDENVKRELIDALIASNDRR